LGRLASRIAVLLMGKHKPVWDPSTDCGDYVVATECADVLVTGRKMAQKKYYTHNTRPGSLRELNMEGLVRKWGGGEVLRKAVRGMLPKNRLRDERMARLKGEFRRLSFRFFFGIGVWVRVEGLTGGGVVFEGAAHPYKANLVKVGGRLRDGYLPVAKAEGPVDVHVGAGRGAETVDARTA
jgi:large subunit ribosomal protein L13